MTSPCSSAAARREIRLFNEGCIAPIPIDNPVTATISGGSVLAKGSSRRPSAISANPLCISFSSPNRRESGPINPPCMTADNSPT